MADIFISYTSSDRDWAFWIARELEALAHAPHIHEWEIKGGDDIYAWMEQRHDALKQSTELVGGSQRFVDCVITATLPFGGHSAVEGNPTDSRELRLVGSKEI